MITSISKLSPSVLVTHKCRQTMTTMNTIISKFSCWSKINLLTEKYELLLLSRKAPFLNNINNNFHNNISNYINISQKNNNNNIKNYNNYNNYNAFGKKSVRKSFFPPLVKKVCYNFIIIIIIIIIIIFI